MNQEEFIIEAKKQGIRDENISSAIRAYTELKKHFPDYDYYEILKTAIQTQKKIDDNPEGFISVD
ncbi:MAG: hypothetical protein LBB89_12330 [Treponema sp.]|nr:hypothetical protein [Treponema sp.]